MIGYEMGFSLTTVYATAEIFTVKNFKHEWKMPWLVGGVLWKSSFLDNPKPSLGL